jgi:proteasome accessory factor A
MVEAGLIMRDLRLENPIRSIRDISHDLTGRKPLKLASGREMSALAMQQEYLSKAREFVEANGAHNPHVERILDLWERTLAAVESGDHSGIEREIDWAIKKRLINRIMDRQSIDLDSPRIAQVDLTYHDISAKRGLYHLLQSRGEVARVVEEQDVKNAMDHPPQTTRAKLRGDFVRAARENGRDFTVDWVHLKLNDRSQQTILCKDPFKSEDPRVEALLATL